MTDPAFVYVTYIDTTPAEAVPSPRGAGVHPPLLGGRAAGDWAPGARVTWAEGGGVTSDPEQTVLECDPPRRLASTWHTFTPEWAAAVGMTAEFTEQAAREPRSRATFDIEEAGAGVKLTVTHDGFPEGSIVREACSKGWPALLSSLKTLLETGAALALS